MGAAVERVAGETGVVVYKVDRLTRSLADFAKLVEVTTDTRTASARAGSTVAPTMMLASSSTSWQIRLAASSTSYSVRSLPPAIEIRRPRAPLNDASSNSGLAIAPSAARRARRSPSLRRRRSSRSPFRS